MARYIVTSGTQFTPFTYDELVRPLAQMTEAHNEAQARYDELASNTAQLERYLSDNPDDDYARSIYDNYMTRLQTLQDNLYRNGFNQGTTRDLSLARTAYSRDIVPMTEAVGRRRKWSDAYKQMQIEHPEMILGRDPASYNLRDYMEDTNFGGFRSYSTSQLTKDTAAAAAAAAKALAPRPRVWDTSSRVPAGYAEAEMTTGYTEAEVETAMKAFRTGQTTTGDERSDELLNIANTIYSQSGMSEWQNDSPGAFDRAASAIGEGMRSAIGETKYEMIQRRDGIYSPAYRASAKSGKEPKETIPDNPWIPLDGEVAADTKEVRRLATDLQLVRSMAENQTSGSGDSGYVAAFDAVRNYQDIMNRPLAARARISSDQLSRLKAANDDAIIAYPALADFDLGALGTTASDGTSEQLLQQYNQSKAGVSMSDRLSSLYDRYGLAQDERTPDNLEKVILREQGKAIRDVSPIIPKARNGENIGKLFSSTLRLTKADTKQKDIDAVIHTHNGYDRVSKDKAFSIFGDKDTIYGITQRPGMPGRIYAQSSEYGDMDIDASAARAIPRPDFTATLQRYSDIAQSPQVETYSRDLASKLFNAFVDAYPDYWNQVHLDYMIEHYPEFSNNIANLEYEYGNSGDSEATRVIQEFSKGVIDNISEYFRQFPNSFMQTQSDTGSEHRWK